MQKVILQLIALSIGISSCTTTTEQKSVFEKEIHEIEDTLHLSEELQIINIYKDQLDIYNQYTNTKDSFKLQNDLKALYKKYKGPWGPDGCFTWKEQQFIKYNKKNVLHFYDAIKEKVRHLIGNNVDSVLSRTFKNVSAYSGYSIKGKYHAYFMPQEMKGFDMGGCDINTMQINLSNKDLSVDGIAKVFPHELNHQIFELSSINDKHYGTVLWGIVDEGFAVYFENKFNNAGILSSLQFTEEAYEWSLSHEKEIYYKTKPLFLSTNMEDEQRLRGNQGKYLIKDAPKRLNYFLGYRIIAQYVKINGEESWRDVYTIPVMELITKSNYEKSLDKNRIDR